MKFEKRWSVNCPTVDTFGVFEEARRVSVGSKRSHLSERVRLFATWKSFPPKENVEFSEVGLVWCKVEDFQCIMWIFVFYSPTEESPIRCDEFYYCRYVKYRRFVLSVYICKHLVFLYHIVNLNCMYITYGCIKLIEPNNIITIFIMNKCWMYVKVSVYRKSFIHIFYDRFILKESDMNEHIYESMKCMSLNVL